MAFLAKAKVEILGPAEKSGLMKTLLTHIILPGRTYKTFPEMFSFPIFLSFLFFFFIKLFVALVITELLFYYILFVILRI